MRAEDRLEVLTPRTGRILTEARLPTPPEESSENQCKTLSRNVCPDPPHQRPGRVGREQREWTNHTPAPHHSCVRAMSAARRDGGDRPPHAPTVVRHPQRARLAAFYKLVTDCCCGRRAQAHCASQFAHA